MPSLPSVSKARLVVSRPGSTALDMTCSGTIEIGRQAPDRNEPLPLATQPTDKGLRLIIAEASRTGMSRDQMQIVLLANDRARIVNAARVLSVYAVDHGTIAPGASQEVFLPVQLRIDDVQIALSPLEEDIFQSLAHPTPAPRERLGDHDSMLTLSAVQADEALRIVQWMNALAHLLRSAASSTAFFGEAAEAVRRLVGLDRGMVVLFQESGYDLRGVSSLLPNDDRSPSWQVLQRVRQERRTCWGIPGQQLAAVDSLAALNAVIAAPLLNARGDVIGAIYGDRDLTSVNTGTGAITEAEARLVETIAGVVAAGLARLDEERRTVEAQVRFEQFFTPALAQELSANPDLLKGQNADISVLFCDIRGFSGITRRLDPPQAIAWINSVLTALSECVLRYEGTLVDYVGDELFAMFGAPVSHADHAQRACRAAIDMVRAAESIDRQWAAIVSEPTRFGIGINSGPALVGNTGAQQKFKYGPNGDTVNTASRVQGATKYLRASPIVTAATRERIGSAFELRALASVRVVGRNEPVELYELAVEPNAQWRQCRETYQAARAHFDAGRFRDAIDAVRPNVQADCDDAPSMVLLSRAVQALLKASPLHDPVWTLDGK